MNITIITVGKPQLSFAQKGIAEYMKRLSRFEKITIYHVKENSKTDEIIIKHIGRSWCIVLDEQGTEYSSHQLSELFENHKNQSNNIALVVGGPDGHSDIIRNRADSLWSLSKLTFPHDVAVMIMLEAIYRAATINAGHPYHRD